MLLGAGLWIASVVHPTALDRFWGPVLDSSSPVVLCISPANGPDPTGQQGASESLLSLRELQKLEAYHVALADAATLSRLAGLLQLKKSPYRIRNAAFTTFTDLRDGPVVLIGAFNNPWTLRLTGPLRFSFEKDLATQTWWIKDRQNPAQGWSVSMTVPHLQLTEDYAIVARLLDPTTERMMVVAAGIGKFGTEAAGEFLADPEHLAPPRRGVLHFEQMSNTITVRLPEDLAEWLKDAARRTGVPKGRIVREELEKARSSPRRPFLRLAGAVSGPADLSSRKGFSRK